MVWESGAVGVASAACSNCRGCGVHGRDAFSDAAKVPDHSCDDAHQVGVGMASPGAELGVVDVFTGGFFESFV